MNSQRYYTTDPREFQCFGKKKSAALIRRRRRDSRTCVSNEVRNGAKPRQLTPAAGGARVRTYCFIKMKKGADAPFFILAEKKRFTNLRQRRNKERRIIRAADAGRGRRKSTYILFHQNEKRSGCSFFHFVIGLRKRYFRQIGG